MSNKTNNTIQAFWIAIGSLSSFLLSIISAVVLSRYLNKDDYGSYKQVLYVYNTLLVVFMAGLPRVFSYFLSKYSLEEGKYIAQKISILLLISGFFFSFFLFFFSDIISDLLKNPDLAYGLKVFSPIPVLLLPTLGIEGIFSTYQKTIYIAIYNIISRLLMLICITTPIIVFGGNYVTALYGWIIASAIMFFVAYYFKNIPFKSINKAKKVSLKNRDILAYSIPLVVASIWGIAIKSADQFYVSRFFGVETFAEFSNGFIEIPLVGMITAATSTVLMPIFSRMVHHEAQVDEVARIWRNALSKSVDIIYPIVIFSIFCATNIIEILYSKTYANSVIYFRICMIVNFFNIIIFAPLIFALNETKFYARLHCYIAIAAWGLGYIVVLIFNSPIAIAILSVSLSVIKIVVAFLFISNKIKVPLIKLFPIKQAFKVALHTLACILISYFSIKMFSIKSIFVELIFTFILYYTLVILTSKLVNIDYLKVYKPLVDKILRRS